MKSNYQSAYNKKYKEETDSLLKIFKRFKSENPDFKNHIRIEKFCNQIINNKNDMIEGNFFKKSIIEEFTKVKLQYKNNKIENFVKKYLSKLQAEHKQLFNKNKSIYSSDPDFLKVSPVKIISFIAKYEAWEDFRLKLLKPNKSIDKKLESDTKSNNKSNSLFKFTKSQQALAIYHILVAMGYDSSYSDKTSIARLIHLLAAIDIPRTISNSHIYKKVKLLYSYKKTTKSSINDLKTILNVFKPLASGQSDIIGKIINKIESELKSYNKN